MSYFLAATLLQMVVIQDEVFKVVGKISEHLQRHAQWIVTMQFLEATTILGRGGGGGGGGGAVVCPPPPPPPPPPPSPSYSTALFAQASWMA